MFAVQNSNMLSCILYVHCVLGFAVLSVQNMMLCILYVHCVVFLLCLQLRISPSVCLARVVGGRTTVYRDTLTDQSVQTFSKTAQELAG